jgi:hypothetical protein
MKISTSAICEESRFRLRVQSLPELASAFMISKVNVCLLSNRVTRGARKARSRDARSVVRPAR